MILLEAGLLRFIYLLFGSYFISFQAWVESACINAPVFHGNKQLSLLNKSYIGLISQGKQVFSTVIHDKADKLISLGLLAKILPFAFSISLIQQVLHINTFSFSEHCNKKILRMRQNATLSSMGNLSLNTVETDSGAVYQLSCDSISLSANWE